VSVFTCHLNIFQLLFFIRKTLSFVCFLYKTAVSRHYFEFNFIYE
ncbi:hypothetical protein X975_22879, partial [Stegodyphus mimosarum]